MDYARFFSEDTASFVSSPTREIFKKVDINSIYSLSGGYPAPEAFPISAMGETMQEVLSKYGPMAFQYGGTQGVEELRRAISARFGEPVERIQITTSSQQGIDVCARVLVDPGDVVLTSNPTYLGALQSFKSYRAKMVGVEPEPTPEAFRAAYVKAIEEIRAEGRRLKLLYIIPDFQNPSGETLTLDERKILASLAEEYDFLILEDCPYKELRYEGESVRSIYSLAPDRVIHLGSFSKIMCPGFRLGWMFANPGILHQIYVCKQALDLCPPVFDQYLSAEFMTSGRLDENLRKSIDMYRMKRDIMLAELEKNMPEGVRWTHPEGGLFLFLTLPEGFDSMAFYDTALSAGVAYVAGNMFFTDFVEGIHNGGSRRGLNTMRLNFSFMTPERLREGVRLLCRLVREKIENTEGQ